MAAQFTRRAFLFSAAAVPDLARRLPSERVRFVDAATEFPMFRLTDPAHASTLTSPCLRAVTKRREFLLFTSDRTGSPQPFRANLASGELQQMAAARNLDGSTLALLPDDRTCCYFDGPALVRLPMSASRGREVYRVPQGWRREGGLSLTPDGEFALFAERGGAVARIRRVRLRDGAAASVLETGGPLRDPLPRPRADDVLYRQEEAGPLWLARAGAPPPEKPVVEGRTGWPAFWSQDGNALMYLRLPSRSGEAAAIRELDAATGAARDLVPGAGFVAFAPNRDGSVFAGVNGNKASPYLTLVLRVNRKELPLCEHRSGNPAGLAPVFSPDSQWLFFQSDHGGRPAIFYIPLERIVEVTAAGAGSA